MESKNLKNKEHSLNLLIETYKLYAAFSAIIIAGIFAYIPSVNCSTKKLFLFTAIISLTICSILCILGTQYFINKAYEGIYDIKTKTPKIITSGIMILLFTGLVSSIIGFYLK